MATRTWGGGTNVWTAAAAWTDGTAPLPDDTAVVSAGIVEFAAGGTLSAATIGLGAAGSPAEVLLTDTLFGYFTTIDSTGASDQAVLAAAGTSGFNGAIDATASGGDFTLATYAFGSEPGDLVLLTGAVVNVSGGDTMLLDGTLTNHSTVDIGSDGDFVNNGTIIQSSGAVEVESGGTLNGGVFEIGLFSSLYFQAGSAMSSEQVRFTDVGGRLLLADPANFAGTISNFETGDLIDLTSTVANGASYDMANRLLTITENGSVVGTLTFVTPAGTGFFTTPDGDGGTLVELDGTQTRVNYTIVAGDRAIGANVVRATMTTPNGTPITGAGVRVGIISGNFDSGDVQIANAAAQAGYLPENPDGTAAVTVLGDAITGDDEGMAMAELVHQVAPGAGIDFVDGGGEIQTFADAITQLQQAGCNVIVDDLSYEEESLFADTSPAATAIDQAVAGGVSYFSSAGNFGSSAYEASFAPAVETLHDGTTVQAQVFGNGSPYQTVTLTAGVEATFDLQYIGTSPDLLQAKLFNMAGQLVATSTPIQTLFPDTSALGSELVYASPTTAQYQLAIYGALPAGSTFKYVLLGEVGGGTTVPGTIDDPAANAGTVFGHALLPDVNAVGAVDFAETPAFGSSTGDAAFYSSTGNADSGKPDILAPVDAATSVAGFAPFAGTSAAAPEAAAVAALMLQAKPSLTPAEITADLENTATGIGQPASVQGAGVVNAVAAVQTALGDSVTACYAAGTGIATARGIVAVEKLRVGDSVVTESGALRPVTWLGHRRVDCRRHRRPAEVWPVRVQAHAFAPHRPARDLFLSPDHAVKLDGALVPIRYLINGATVAQLAVASVTYWHVELPSHDVLLAEGLPAESYLDTGNRAAFGSAGGVVALHPAFSRRVWAEQGCAPLLTDGPLVAQAHARLLARATRLGHRLGDDPDLRLRVAGRTLLPRMEGGRWHVRLPAGAKTLRLLSRTWVPAHHGEADVRQLGVPIAGLALDGQAVALDDARLGTGWHADEGGWRWTDGAAILLADGAREVAFGLALPARYWREQARGGAPRPRWGRGPQTPF